MFEPDEQESEWKEKAPSTVIYTSPFSETSIGIRKKLLFFSALIVLNFFFPVDIQNSHILGIKFQEGVSLSLEGLLSLIVTYFLFLFVVYCFQEVKTWLGRAKELEYFLWLKNLRNILTVHHNAINSIKHSGEQLALFNKEAQLLRNQLESREWEEKERYKFESLFSSVSVHLESSKNFLDDFSPNHKKFSKAVVDIEKLNKSVHKDYKRALYSQFFKVYILEIIFPFLFALVAVWLSCGELFLLLNNLFFCNV